MSDSDTSRWDEEVDLLVVGSGAGAMTAGVVGHDRHGKVLLIEKSDRYGGSSAMSGGSLWIPRNHFMEGTGIEDSREEAMVYLREITAGEVDSEKLEAFVDHSADALRYLADRAHVNMYSMPAYSDYYPRAKGSKPGGRSLDPETFDARSLGDDLLNMRDQNLQMLVMGRLFMTIPESRTMLTRAPGWIWLLMRLAFRYISDLPWRFKSKRDRFLAMGNALVGMLRQAMLDRGIPLWLNAGAEEFVVEDGRVIGVVVMREGERVRVRARKGVILAAGGFEGSQAMREKYLPAPTRVDWTCANRDNTGDVIGMARDLGAGVEFMDEAWWGPVTVVPGEENARMLVIEKSLPGSVMVNKRGERFVNEAAPYIDVVNAQYASDSEESPCVPCYLIFDARFRRSYPIGPLLPGAQQPDLFLGDLLRDGYLKKANSVGELATQLGLDPTTLETTVARYNEFAQTGSDLDFGRGDTVFDRYYGDEKVKPNPCLAPIVDAPFYGMESYPGELGTKGGIRTDARARVLTESGEIIPGLYAVGNCSSPVMGRTYAGAGATLGPSTTFAYIAARDALPEEDE
jgi:3-oxosteroid 1-dehydrogenase